MTTQDSAHQARTDEGAGRLSSYSWLPTSEPERRFGTFLGVFTPSVLTILGVMMYLRFGWVVGNVGLPLALVILKILSNPTDIRRALPKSTSSSIASSLSNGKVNVNDCSPSRFESNM